MKNVRTPLSAIIVLALAMAACAEKRPDAAPDTQPAPTDASSSLTLAHEAYLAGNWVEMGERLKEVIVDPHTGELARDNAFALLESAYAATQGQLPARTALPHEVRSMSLGVLNGANPLGAHRAIYLYLRVAEGRAAHVKEMRLTRLPSEPILALSEERGALSVAHVMKGFEDIKLEARALEVLPDRGAFGIEVVFDDGPRIDTFVLANKLVGSTHPEVTAPAMGQTFDDPRPEIAWRPFRSPELASWEARAVSVWIGRDATKDTAWSFYQREPGELASVRSSTSLDPGSYWVSVMCSEERSFGGIWISRMAETGRSFSVVR